MDDFLLAAAERYGTPTYVYDADMVRRRARLLKAAFHHPRTQLLYAIKANPCPALVRILLAEGYGVDAVSPGEMQLALALGCAPAQICYTENNMTDAEQEQALAAGVTINCGSLDRLQRLADAGVERAALRFNPDVGDSEHAHTLTAGPLTKFGVHHSQVAAVRAIEEKSRLRVIGCHMHIGSNILSADSYRRAMRVIVDVARALPHIEWVNVGGGLGVPYQPGQEPIDIAEVGRAADQLIAELEEQHCRPLELRLEPGRFLVAEAGHLLTTVTSIKENPDQRVFIGCDSGFNHLIRPTMYGSYHPIYNLSQAHSPARVVDVVGNICESGDIFARDRSLPAVQLGSLLAIGCAGAYGMSMASTYNLRPLPAEVFYDQGSLRLLRRRRSLQELINDLEDE